MVLTSAGALVASLLGVRRRGSSSSTGAPLPPTSHLSSSLHLRTLQHTLDTSSRCGGAPNGASAFLLLRETGGAGVLGGGGGGSGGVGAGSLQAVHGGHGGEGGADGGGAAAAGGEDGAGEAGPVLAGAGHGLGAVGGGGGAELPDEDG